MDINLKQRLVGIAVVVTLAVIFLPMILDGSGVRKNTLEVVIPPKPVLPSNPEFEQKIVELHAKVEELPGLPVTFVDEDSGEDLTPVSKTRSQAVPAISPLTQQKTKTVQKTVTVASTANKTGGESWILQVGSYKDKSKALAQRDLLRKSKIAAVFIEQFDNKGKLIYRVRLGPFVDSDKAKIAQNKIKAKYNIDGYIVQYEK